MTSPAPPSVPPSPAPASSRGPATCLLIGCFTILCASVFMIVGGYFLVRMLMSNAVERYTTAEPIALTTVPVAEGEYEALRTRIDAFVEGLESEHSLEPLELSGHDLNVLILEDPDQSDLQDILRVHIEDDKIRGELSLPLDRLFPGIASLQGRFLTGEGEFTVSLVHDYLTIRLQSLTVNGAELPGLFDSALKDQDFAEELRRDPEFRRIFRHIERIEVADGTIRLWPKHAE